MQRRVRWDVWLVISFAFIVASFVTATLVARSLLATVDRAALDIAENAAPSIQNLTAARTDVRTLQLALRDDLDRPGRADDVEAARRALNTAIDAYLQLPVFPGERALQGDLVRARDALDTAVTLCLSQAASGDIPAARMTFRRDVTPQAEALSNASMHTIDLNAGQAHDLALEIRGLHERSTRLAILLDTACVALTFVGAVLLWRVVRSRMALVERHRALVEARADSSSSPDASPTTF